MWESNLFTADKVRATKGKSPLPYAEKERERYIERRRWTEGGEEHTNFSPCFLSPLLIHKICNIVIHKIIKHYGETQAIQSI